MKLAFLGPALAGSLMLGSVAVRAQSPIAPAVAGAPAGLVVVESAHPVAETERRLVHALEGAGLKVAARIDHAANARSVGLDLPPTLLVIFGNPRAGTLLMEQNRSIGLDLPLKMLIWEVEGRVRLAYTDPSQLAGRYGIPEATPVLSQITQALQRLAAAATAP